MTESFARSWIGSSPSHRPRKPWPMSKRDAPKARSSYHSSENVASEGEHRNDQRRRSGVRLSGAPDEQSRDAGSIPDPPIERTLSEPGQGNHRDRAEGTVDGAAPLGLEGTGGRQQGSTMTAKEKTGLEIDER